MTRVPVGELGSWINLQVGQYYLHIHPDLEVTVTEDKNKKIIMLGYVFDPQNYRLNNQEILDRVFQAKDFDSLIFEIKPLVGRYVFIFYDNNALKIVHDPLGLREVYYCQEQNRVMCGSQPNLLVEFSSPKIQKSSNPNLVDFINNHLPNVRNGRLWVGNETCYQSVNHLPPNHWLELPSIEVKRYWPNRKLHRIDYMSAVQQSCDFLRNTMKAVTDRYSVMMAVTAGTDSRSLLAASRDVTDKIYYFINKEPSLTEMSADIFIPKKIFNKLGLPFHIHEIKGRLDEEFRRIFLNNTWMSSELILPTIYHVYYKQHQDKINVLGVGEIGREYYGKPPHDLDGYYLARILKYRNSMYAVAQCEKWLQQARPVTEKYNVDIMKLFLWEGLLANWGVVGNSESDIAIEEFDPYNSHHIYEIMLSVEPAQGDLFKGIFEVLWPELLEFPFNPSGTFKDRIKILLKKTGIFYTIRNQLYRFDRWRFKKLLS